MKVLVESLVLSIMRYFVSVYGLCGSTQVRRIKKIVNFCDRMVTGWLLSDHVPDAVELLGWLTAQQLVDFHAILCSATCHHERGTCMGVAHHGPPASETQHHDTRHGNGPTAQRAPFRFQIPIYFALMVLLGVKFWDLVWFGLPNGKFCLKICRNEW